jgi:hypothetical protein
VLDAPAPFVVDAAIEDEQHHFRLRLSHDGSSVTGVSATAVRWPWSPCIEASSALSAAVGVALSADLGALGRWTPARQQCTHQFDLLGLAMTHAAALSQVVGVPARSARRQYDATVPDWSAGPCSAFLARDGVRILTWSIDRDTIVSPEAFAGAKLRDRFIDWCVESLSLDDAEAALVLRRAVWMSPSRHLALEACDTAIEGRLAPDVCFSAQPARIEVAVRNRGSLRDFGASADPLLADLVPPADGSTGAAADSAR